MNNRKENSINLSKNKNNWPATLYVEGQDQFRGWFNSSLITSTILTNQTPYQQVLSHGFVVDEKGHKMSKSLGNVIDPEDIIKKFGADLLRLWVVSCDFTKEIKVSIPILKNLQESYQKIRNTCRFLLGNLVNLPPKLQNENGLEKELSLADYYILWQLEKLLEESQQKYSEYNFNNIYISLLSFCTNELSSFYFEISKDSLYCDSLNSSRRKQIITALYYLLGGLLKIIRPIFPYLAEEIYQNIPFHFGFANNESVHLADLSLSFSFPDNYQAKIKLITDFFLPLRQDIFFLLEKVRQEKTITANSQASCLVYCKESEKYDLSLLNWTELLLVAEVSFSKQLEKNMVSGFFCSLHVTKTDLKRCLRCWNWQKLENDVCWRCKNVLLV